MSGKSNQSPKILFLPHANIQYSQLAPERRAWVVEHSYKPLFDIIESRGVKISFEASGETLKVIAETHPKVLDKLTGLIRDGQIEPVGSPYTHIMMANVPKDIAYLTLVDGLDAWEQYTGVRPTVGWNPECSWAHYLPEIYKAAGYETLVMDGDSFMLSFPEIRKATGLSFDVRGHSNKSKLFAIEEFISDKDDYLKFLTNPSVASNGLKMIFRSDIMANPMLWYLMGATEGHRSSPIVIEEIETMLMRWHERVLRSGAFILPYAEDAEYIGTTAYFYVKQFNQARFFEKETESLARFTNLLEVASACDFETATVSEAVSAATAIEDNTQIDKIENGIAWHGGTAKAWANTTHARILDVVCRSVWDGINAICERLDCTATEATGTLREAIRKLTSAYVSDSRWPPAPTSPGRFNVQESIADLYAANELVGRAMVEHGLEEQRALYSPALMKTQIASIEDELMEMQYFGEDELVVESEAEMETVQ